MVSKGGFRPKRVLSLLAGLNIEPAELTKIEIIKISFVYLKVFNFELQLISFYPFFLVKSLMVIEIKEKLNKSEADLD